MNHWTLANGLQVYHIQDPDSTQVVLNLLYKVGARDESPERTGFAHLFEHLMFAGSANVPSFDKEIEGAGGQNNAFTNNEFTNYYILVPAENTETAFWLESDRMRGLNINPESLRVQQGVVVEEFKQRCFNAPFGQLWHHVRSLLYAPESSYSWPTIGLNFEQIETASLADVRAFYDRFYQPSNAILSLAGALDEAEARRLSEKWFGDIANTQALVPRDYNTDTAPVQAPQEQHDLSPDKAIFLIWPTPSHANPASNALDLFAEILGGSEASPLNETLVKQEGIMSAAECFCLKGLGEGFFVLYGILAEGISHQAGQEALLRVLNETIHTAAEDDLASVKNRMLTQLLYERISPAQQAQKIAYCAALGKPEWFDQEAEMLEAVSLADCLQAAKSFLNADEARLLFYSPNHA